MQHQRGDRYIIREKKGGEETENTNRNFIDADPIHKRCPYSK